MGSASHVLSHESVKSGGSVVSKKIPHIVEMPCKEKSISTKEFQQVKRKIRLSAICGHVCKNEAVSIT